MKIQSSVTMKSPSKKMLAEYKRFIETFTEHTRKRNAKRKKEERVNVFVAQLRGKKKMLVPDGVCYPCEVCASAAYNQGCPNVVGCAAIAYHGLVLLSGIAEQDARVLLTGLTATKGKLR